MVRGDHRRALVEFSTKMIKALSMEVAGPERSFLCIVLGSLWCRLYGYMDCKGRGLSCLSYKGTRGTPIPSSHLIT